MNRAPVRQSFNRAATSYTATATLQQQVAEQLVRDVHGTTANDFSGNILDAGCGTGDCLSRLQSYYPAATLIGIDFAEAMLHQLPQPENAWRINADLQQLPLADAHIDLYISSLAWQWCDLTQAVDEAARVLRPGGDLWLTTLVAGTFDEFAATLRAAALTPALHLLQPLDKPQILDAIRRAPFQVAHAQCDALTTFHPDFASLRRSIRGVGANHAPGVTPELISRAARQRLIEAYEGQRTSHGLPLTYQVLTLHAQRF